MLIAVILSLSGIASFSLGEGLFIFFKKIYLFIAFYFQRSWKSFFLIKQMEN